MITSWAPVMALSHPDINAYKAPNIAPDKSISIKWIKKGNWKLKPTITAAIPPSIICPSAPILNSPALKPTAIPKAAKINGVAAVNVSEIADSEPKDP